VHSTVTVAPADLRDAEVLRLVDELTAELAGSGYSDDEMFGYTAEQLERGGVHLLGAGVDGRVVGIGGVELQDGGTAELKRFYVRPEHRGAGVADALMAPLVEHARRHDARVLRLETGDRQHAALSFYRRHGFVEVPRFPPYTDSEASICMERAL